MNKLVSSLLGGVGLLALAASPSFAVLQLSANINGTVVNCADGQACDTNLAPGQLSIANQTVNGVEIQGANQIQQIGTSNNLNTSSFQIINHNLAPATITLAISGINYLGPVSSFNATGSGSWQNANSSTINLTFYADPANTQGADTPIDLPGTQLFAFGDTAVGPADSFNQSLQGAFVAAGLYSMSLGTSGTLAAWNGLVNEEPTLVGRAQAIVTTQVVPEPASLLILGGGLIGMAAVLRRRNRRAPVGA